MRPLKALISKNTLNRAHSGNVLSEIKNFTYEDVITPGNILLVHGGNYNTHHAIVVDDKCASQFIQHLRFLRLGLTLNTKSEVTYWELDTLDDDNFTFNNGTVIYKVFKTNIDIKNIKSVKDLEKLYTKYNLIKLTK